MFTRIFLAITLVGIASCVVYKDCTSGSALKYQSNGGNSVIKSSLTGPITKLEISGCAQDAKVCMLPRGQNVTVTVHFTTALAAAKATAVVHGIIAGASVPFPIANPDACKDCGLTCPLKVGSAYVYTTQIYVQKYYPKISLVVKWEVKNESSKDVFCLETPVQIP